MGFLFLLLKTKGAIAAGDPLTAEAGHEMFRLGGNAFDAVVAASFASFTTEAALTSAGGGGFFLAHHSDGKQVLYDFFVQTPLVKKAERDIEFYPVELNFGDGSQVFHIGAGSMAVPGNVAGLFHVHSQLGKLPIKEVMAPAIQYAGKGITYSDYQEKVIRVVGPCIAELGADSSIFFKDGDLLKSGDHFRNTDFADTLEALSKEGPRMFYEGEIAKLLIDCSEKQHGQLTAEDLKHFKVIERKPFEISYRGTRILTNPMPSLGGVLIGFTLKLLENFDLKNARFGSRKHMNALVSSLDFTNIGREKFLHDHWQSDSSFDLNAPNLKASFDAYLTGRHKPGNTTHISAIDGDGNSAGLTTSHGEGSGVMIPETGIIMNNMLGEADLNPLGFHQWKTGSRIPSMMAPTFVMGEQGPSVVLGTGGSNRIRTAMVQVLSNMLDFGMGIEAAIAKPRLHLEKSTLDAEPGDFNFDLKMLEAMELDLKNWSDVNIFFGGVHTVKSSQKGDFSAIGDLRRNGSSLLSK